MKQIIDVTGLPQPVVHDIERLVATLRGNATAAISTVNDPDSLTLEEFEKILDEMSEGLPALPTLPADFSREDIYCDHD